MTLATLLAINWEPTLRGIIVVITMAVALIGGTYLIVGSNLGARLGILVILGGFFGWMAIMGAIWWTYGIGLVGASPTWQPAEPATIVRDARLLQNAEIVAGSVQPSPSLSTNAVASVGRRSTKHSTSSPSSTSRVTRSSKSPR